MKIKILVTAFLLAFVFVSCTKKYDCTDLQIQPAFINFSPSDIDTFILRKFKPSDNYQNLVTKRLFIVKETIIDLFNALAHGKDMELEFEQYDNEQNK